MQRDRNHSVGLKFFSCFANHLGKALGKPVAQPGYLLILQKHDRAGHGVVVISEAASPLESIEICTAEAAKFRSLLNLRRKLKGRSAA
jgi:hypothetical protein